MASLSTTSISRQTYKLARGFVHFPCEEITLDSTCRARFNGEDSSYLVET